ncbi:unnamed protein product [Adineta steineri]|uniref:RNA helicase n=2 Tax=Adineta steineri TaxID=433720 RepID=A0A814HED1_9BILA|nr:unnamed protein product [Adineta steineri]
MPSDIEFRQLLLDVENDLTDEEHKRFVFLLGDDIPRRQRDAPLVVIFTTLIDLGRISERDCSYLMKIFEKLKLLTVAYRIAQFEARFAPPVKVPEDIQPIENGRNNSITPDELVNDFLTDGVIISDIEQTSSPDSPVINEPVTPITTLSLKNSDLEIFENDIWSDEFLQKINVKNIRPYEYQRVLVQSSIQAGNTIICLRAGGGKTLVAALLFKYYLIKKTTSENDKKFLAFFIVPRRAMLKEQLEKLKQVGNLRVVTCDEHIDVTQYTDNYDIIICTPQRLLNCLKAKTILVSNIDLLCFDDCHDSVTRNQYIGIMQYIMCKNIDDIPPVDSPPIIIGLTAIGVQSFSSSQVIRSLTDLCAIFNCLKITTLSEKENEEELERCVTRISDDEIIYVEKQDKYETLRKTIEKELKDLILYLFINKDTNPLRIFPEKRFDENGYDQNLELLKQSEQKNQHFSSVLLLNYTLHIYRHLRALTDLTPHMVLSDLKDQFEMMYKSREHPINIDTLIYNHCHDVFEKKLKEIEDSEQILTNSKLEKLVELLKNHAKNTNSRALILVEKIFYAKKICEFLENHSDLKNIVKPCWLVSQNSASNVKLNRSQKTTLEEFQTGVYNVMISTDVVQAGLNIPQCSLVLRYDFVPDSIGTVQARVRARATDCKYGLITTKDSPNHIKERDSRQCEQNLKNILEIWKGISLNDFQQGVLQTKESFIQKWEESLLNTITLQINISESTELTGDVLCRACGYILGELGKVRQYENAYFISEQDFYNRIEEKIFNQPRIFARSSDIGKALCGNKSCRTQLGCIKKLNDYPEISPIYPLKCASIKIKSETGEMILKTKWSQMPFKFPKLSKNVDINNDDDDIFYDASDSLPGDS